MVQSVAVHFNPVSLATILSLKAVAELPSVHITMDTAKESSILVHMTGAPYSKFLQCEEGLFYLDTDNLDAHRVEVNSGIKPKSQVSSYLDACFIKTVAVNKKFFTKHEITLANGKRIPVPLGVAIHPGPD